MLKPPLDSPYFLLTIYILSYSCPKNKGGTSIAEAGIHTKSERKDETFQHSYSEGRITQIALKLIIEPQLEPRSLGFGSNKSAHDAVYEIMKNLNFGCENVIDADITACFHNIDKQKLMEEVARKISDGSLLQPI